MPDYTHQTFIRENLEQVEKQGKMNALSMCFFTHLFQLEPELADVLNGDVSMLHRKFSSTIATLKNIRYLDKISSAIEAMAIRHVGYGAEIRHFKPFRQALWYALEEVLGDDFTPQHQKAWQTTFDAVADIMQQVMQKHPSPQGKKTISMTQETHLLDDIGGKEKVLAVHQRLYDFIYDDAYLLGFFQHRSKRELIEKQTEFMLTAFGGGHHYHGQPPAFIHMHMFITKSIAQRWLAIDHAFHASIEKKTVDECVMRALFQQPLKVTKPEGYQAPVDDT